eukprot:3211785-Lingulodinium_polyedra.AAC.1
MPCGCANGLVGLAKPQTQACYANGFCSWLGWPGQATSPSMSCRVLVLLAWLAWPSRKHKHVVLCASAIGLVAH